MKPLPTTRLRPCVRCGGPTPQASCRLLQRGRRGHEDAYCESCAPDWAMSDYRAEHRRHTEEATDDTR